MNALPRTGPPASTRGDRWLSALQQVEVLAGASGVTPGQQVACHRQHQIGGIRKQRWVHHAQIQRCRQRRVVQEFGHDPVLQQGQRPVDLLRREEMAGCAPGVTGGLEPFGRPQLKRLLASPVPGPQLSAQQLAHQMVVPETGPLVIERHQEQVALVNSAQQRRRVLPRSDGRARAHGQLPQHGGVEHEPGHFRRLLIKNLRDEVLGDRVAADIKRPRGPHRVSGGA